FDPGRALDVLDQAPLRTQESSSGRTTRCYASGMRAFMTSKPEHVEQALASRRRLNERIENTPGILQGCLLTELLAGLVFAAGDPRVGDAKSAAARDFERLAGFPDSPHAVRSRCLYHYVRGDNDKLLEEAGRARQRGIETPSSLVLSILY